MPGGEAEEFTRYASTARPFLRLAAFRLTADWHEAEDLSQRTLIALYGRWETLGDRDRIGGYAHKVMLRMLISDRRTRRWSSEVLAAAPPETVPDRTDVAASVADRLVLAEAMAALAPRQRAVLTLRFLEDRSVEDTARILGCRASTVRSQTARALGVLRVRLGRPLPLAVGEPARFGTQEEAPEDPPA